MTCSLCSVADAVAMRHRELHRGAVLTVPERRKSETPRRTPPRRGENTLRARDARLLRLTGWFRERFRERIWGEFRCGAGVGPWPLTPALSRGPRGRGSRFSVVPKGRPALWQFGRQKRVGKGWPTRVDEASALRCAREWRGVSGGERVPLSFHVLPSRSVGAAPRFTRDWGRFRSDPNRAPPRASLRGRRRGPGGRSSSHGHRGWRARGHSEALPARCR